MLFLASSETGVLTDPTGMVDIARQTVEFLYEENGGIPRDLYLPTIEDIKDEANKFTTDKVRKGTVELLLHVQLQPPRSALPVELTVL